MKGFFKVIGGIAISCVCVFLFLLWDESGCWPIPATRGRLDARIDLSRGRYRQLGWGLPPLGMDKYISLLHQRYGVDYQNVGGCTASPAQRDYVAAYDSVSEPAINRKAGRDIFKEAASESFELQKTTPVKNNANPPAE